MPDVDHRQVFRPERREDGRRVGFGSGIVALTPNAKVVEGFLIIDKHQHWLRHRGSLHGNHASMTPGMMLSGGELRQRKTMMIASAAMMPAIVAGLPGKSVRTESPLALDKAASRSDR